LGKRGNLTFGQWSAIKERMASSGSKGREKGGRGGGACLVPSKKKKGEKGGTGEETGKKSLERYNSWKGPDDQESRRRILR